MKVSPATDMTAEMLREEHPQFEEANFILLEIEEVNIYLGLNIHTCMHVHCTLYNAQIHCLCIFAEKVQN